MRGDTIRARQALDEVRAHHLALMPDVAARADLAEALLAVAEGDDARAERLLQSLTHSADLERDKTARRILLATGASLATLGAYAGFSALRPLLEFLRDQAPEQTANWATCG